MAGKLSKLIIILIFVSFRPRTSFGSESSEELNIVTHTDQHVKEDQVAGSRPEEDLQDQTSTAAENAVNQESQESPGFFQQMMSELAAPLYEEEDFISEDNHREEDNPDNIKNEEGVADHDSSDHSPEENQGVLVDTPDEKGQLELDIPQFTVSKFLKSVTEDSQTTQTAVNSDSRDEKQVIWPEVASVPYLSSKTEPDGQERQEKANVVEEQTQSHEEDQQERSEALMKQQEESDKVKEDEEEQKRKLETLRKQHDRMGDHNEASKEQSGDQHRIPKTNRNLMENGNQERQEKANVVEELKEKDEDRQERLEAFVKQQEESEKVKKDEKEGKLTLETLSKQHDRMDDQNEASEAQSGDQQRIPKTNRNLMENGNQEQQEKANVVEEQKQIDQEDPQERLEVLVKQQEESDKVKKDEEEQKPELETLKKQPDGMGGHNEASKEQSGDDQHRISKTNRNLMENGNEGDVNINDLKRRQPQRIEQFPGKTNMEKAKQSGKPPEEKREEKVLQKMNGLPQSEMPLPHENVLKNNQEEQVSSNGGDEEDGEEEGKLKGARNGNLMENRNGGDVNIKDIKQTHPQRNGKSPGKTNMEKEKQSGKPPAEKREEKVLQEMNGLPKSETPLPPENVLKNNQEEQVSAKGGGEEDGKEEGKLKGARNGNLMENRNGGDVNRNKMRQGHPQRTGNSPGKTNMEKEKKKRKPPAEKREEKVLQERTGLPKSETPLPHENVLKSNQEEQVSPKGRDEDGDEEHKLKGARLAQKEADLKKKLEMLDEERKEFEQMAKQYKINKHTSQPKVQKGSEHTEHSPVRESAKSPVKEPEEPARVVQATMILPVSATSIISSWTPTAPAKKITATKTPIPSTSSTGKATERIVPTATLNVLDSATVVDRGPEVTVAPKVILEPTIQPVEQIPQDNNTISAYAAFMQGFRAFHESAFQRFMAYWPVMRNATRDVLAYVGLDGMFEQLCSDLADVHPAVLFGTFLFGTLGILYFFWSLTFGRTRHGAQGPHPRDVLRSHQARIRILEEEVKASGNRELTAMNERDSALKLKLLREEQLKDTEKEIKRLKKEIEEGEKARADLDEYVTKLTGLCKDSQDQLKQKTDKITEYQNMISELEAEANAKETEIRQIRNELQDQLKEIQASRQHIEDLNSTIQQGDVENKKLENLLQEAKGRKDTLQAEFDDQFLRLSELQQQYNFKCDEVEVLQDCLKQIKGNPTDDDNMDETDPHEMEKRLQDMMDVSKAKTDLEKSVEAQRRMEAELEEHKKTRKMLENETEEIREKLVQLQSQLQEATLTRREKEIECETLQRYFKSAEVELHRKLTAEESARINTENQLQSEQAKASTAVVDADKYRQLYLDIKKQIEEIDQSKKEQLSNMEAKAHQNWLDYRAAAKEVDALKEENDLLRRRLYDMEVRGSRPGSSASSSQMNHVDGRDSPRQSPHMTGPPGHGSPVPFAPMMGPPPPPPPSMFAGQRRHPAEMLMTPPRPPFPPPGHATPPPATSTPQTSKSDGHDSKDGSPHLPPPPPPPMSGFGPRPLPPMMGMPRFPLPPPMMPPPVSGGQRPPMFMPGAPLPPPTLPGPRPPT